MGGSNTRELLESRADPVEQPSPIRGRISSNRPAPTGFPTPGTTENLLWVISPDYSPDVPIGPCQWNADHGKTLPVQGAECVVTFDYSGVPTVTWWAGAYS
jgi:hypothetical protein